MEPACAKNAKISVPTTSSLTDAAAELFNNEYIIDADGNTFDKNGKFTGRTWEAVRNELTWEMSEAYGVDFFKVNRMREAGMLQEKDITNELLLSSEFKFVPNPALAPKPWPKSNSDEVIDEELEREIERATEEAIAEMIAEDDWEDEPDTL
jgi:hypothetical protein